MPRRRWPSSWSAPAATWLSRTWRPGRRRTVRGERPTPHLPPTPLGSTVRLRAEVVAVEGESIDFLARLWDEQDQVGEVEHRRRVVDLDRFLRRGEGKGRASATPGG